MSVESTRAAIEAYEGEHGADAIAEDAVYTDTSTGQQYVGREAVLGMLRFFYQEAFDARFERLNLIVDDGHAALEGLLVGRHVGEFAGVPATGREVRVPYAVVYDVAEDGIRALRIYLAPEHIVAQITGAPAMAEASAQAR